MSNLIEIIHSVSNKLTNISDEQEIYQIMNDAIKQILPNSYFLITKLQPDEMNFRITHSFGIEKYISPIKTLLGKDPFEMDFLFSDLSPQKQKQFQSRKLYHFKEGIFDIANGRINKTISKTIEKILGISEVYAVSFCIGKKHFGGATLFVPKSTIDSGRLNEDSKLTIESLAAQVSFAINKLRDVDILIKKDNELLIAQSKFNQLVHQLNDIVWIAKGDGTDLVDLNNSFEKYFGYPEIDFVENPNKWLDIVHPEDKEIASNSGKLLDETGNAECEYRIIKSDGTILWLHERKSIVYDKQGNAVQMGGVASDVTEKKYLEEELRLKDYALEYSPNAVVFTDLIGHITYVNKEFLKLFAYEDSSQILGKMLTEFVPFDETTKEQFEQLKTSKILIKNAKPRKNDGSEFHSIIMASPVIHESKTLCLMAVFTDISELKTMETNLMESEAKLLKSNQEKDKFFTIIAHDLKAPFNGMLGLLKILTNSYNNYSDDQRINIIEASHKAAKEAFTLLSNLLEWAKLHNNYLSIKPEIIDLNTIVEENIKLHSNASKAKQISITNHIKPQTEIELDLNSINTLVRNLLMNAIKFTNNNGQINIKSSSSNVANELIIEDNGIGMNQVTMDHLFELNGNLTQPGTNNEKGTGLGLLICKEIVLKNNWKMSVESKLGIGSTFKITMPKNKF